MRRAGAGFTLIEILVVMLIVGIMIAGAALSFRVAGNDREVEKERDRIVAISEYLRDQAALQNREFGIRCFIGGYEYVVLNVRTGLWERVVGDSITQSRNLPKGIDLTLLVEGRQIVLPKADVGPDELAPQILLYSSGEMSLFELTLRRRGGVGVRFTPSATTDRIDVANLAVGAT